MADISNKLKIKYGLRNSPEEKRIREWVELVRRLQRQGVSGETAGRAAAKTLFPDYESVKYASEADELEALLAEAEKK